MAFNNYQVATGNTPAAIASAVQALIGQGYQPFGPMALASQGTPVYSQAMTLGSPVIGATQNISQTTTTDPGAANDVTQGYTPGSFWLNTTTNRVWMCFTNAAGAAVWALDGVVVGVGVEPSGMLTQFGSSTASFPEEGNINRQISSAGVQPSSTAADIVLAVYSLPASAFDVLGRGLTITAAGAFGATANNKTVKLIWNPATAVVGSAVGAGGTTFCTTGVVNQNGGGWQVMGTVFKYGAAGSNTQLCVNNGAVGTTHFGVTAPALAAAVESGAILIAVTGNAATAASDITYNWLEVNAMN